MPKLPVIKGRELIKLLESVGFRITRTKGSHVRLRSEDTKENENMIDASPNRVYLATV